MLPRVTTRSGRKSQICAHRVEFVDDACCSVFTVWDVVLRFVYLIHCCFDLRGGGLFCCCCFVFFCVVFFFGGLLWGGGGRGDSKVVGFYLVFVFCFGLFVLVICWVFLGGI